jgi:hypothetical protein
MEKKSSLATRFIEFDYFQAENTPRVFLTNSCLNNSIVAADFFQSIKIRLSQKRFNLFTFVLIIIIGRE